MIHIGFTGTQKGMTLDQADHVTLLLADHDTFVAHHGACIGADADFHMIVRLLGDNAITLHPSNIFGNQADCQLLISEACMRPLPPLVRNKRIVEQSDFLIACPGEKQMKIRSGTWSTIRYAQSVGKKTIIVFPDGSKAEA